MAFLTPDKTRTEYGLVIKEKIIPWGGKWARDWNNRRKGDKYKADRLLSQGTGKVEYVTIHNTADIAEAKGTNDAEQYTRATWPNQNMGDARVHYFIDETDCWQNLREDEVGWHAGDGVGPGNDTSLGIEIIMDGSGSEADTQAEDRGALLAAILLKRHGLGIDRLVPHKKWSGKYCPVYILPHWDTFVSKVSRYLAAMDTVYYIQVGPYRNKPFAEDTLRKLKSDGFSASLVKSNELPQPEQKTVKEIAKEVISGKWGAGDDRVQRLTAAGYDAKAVQAEVNKQLS